MVIIWLLYYNSAYALYSFCKVIVLYLQIKGDGDCFLMAMLEQIEFQSEGQKKRYTPVYIRCQALVHFMETREEFGEEVMKGIRDEYGLVEDQEDDTHPGPFSVYAWVRYMSQDKTEADGILIKLIASMLGCRITVVRSDSCKEVRFRHDKNLGETDFAVLFNCAEKDGHYSAIMHIDKTLVKAGSLKRFRNFDYEGDLREREQRWEGIDFAGGEYKAVKAEELKLLKFKTRQYDRVKVLMEATQQTEPDSFVQSPSEQKQLGSDIADPKEGEKECGKCNKKFKSTGS